MSRLWVTLAVLVGILAGLGGFTLWYAKGLSYLTNDPRACVNCHIMREQYDGWSHSSHKAVAVCNDCHTPKHLVNKYFTKALNGYNHSVKFTFGGFHEPIQMTPRNRRVTEGACRTCHQDIVAQIDHADAGKPMDCIRCHRNVGHLH